MKLIDENAPHPELEPMDMHGPVEVDVRVYVKQGDGTIGRMTFTHPTGILPARLELAQYLAAAGEEAARANATLPTKAEFVAHITKRETGQSIPMAGSMEYVAVDSEAPDGH